ncbi:hypothetical protein B0H14DRAFT_3730473 [Mycena olivaceomarginata]|nr:hypothetical protein B0H14DRAFT_3730473 [Mycena olivaceomarginata]
MTTTDDICGMFQDHQLLLNTMAGLIDAPWTFNCSGVETGDTQQFGPTFKDCADDGFHSLPNLCIGGIKDQHACSVGTCNVIDWNGAVAAPCASNIMHFVTSQAPGMATPCCNSTTVRSPAETVAPPSGSTGNTVSHAFPTNEPNTVAHGFPGTTATDGSAASQTPTNGLDNTAASSGGHSARDVEDGVEGKSGSFTSGNTVTIYSRVLTYAKDQAADNGSVGPGFGIYQMTLAGLALYVTVNTCMIEEAAVPGIGRTSKRRPGPMPHGVRLHLTMAIYVDLHHFSWSSELYVALSSHGTTIHGKVRGIGAVRHGEAMNDPGSRASQTLRAVRTVYVLFECASGRSLSVALLSQKNTKSWSGTT